LWRDAGELPKYFRGDFSAVAAAVPHRKKFGDSFADSENPEKHMSIADGIGPPSECRNGGGFSF
jgi:hypothetical protein